MNDYLKLTAYFAERLRTHRDFVAEELLDLYGRSEVATSIMLRGVTSFGPHHQMRTDETLTMSEDPPVAVAAVDTADKISALADEVVNLTTRGLITLERARLDTSAVPVPNVAGPAAPVPNVAGPAAPENAKLTIYIGRQERAASVPAYIAVCDLLHRRGFAGATALLGVDGTSHGKRRRARFFNRNVDVPVMIIAIGTGQQVTEAIPKLHDLLREPLMTVERAQLCKRDGERLTRPAALPPSDIAGRALWQKLMVYTSEAVRHDGMPIHRAIVRRLYASGGVSGATVLRGIWGFHGNHEPHGDRLLQLGRRVPVTTIIVDSPERIADGFEIVDELTDQHGLVTCELVPALVSIDAGQRRGGTNLAWHPY